MSLLTIGTPSKYPVLYAFDLDGTLINTKSSKTFPVDADDWIIINNSFERLAKLSKDSTVIIITNQKLKDQELVIAKLNNISAMLPGIAIYAALEDDEYRKPGIGVYKELPTGITEFNYIGDAAGRQGDHSDSDAKFLFNVKLYNRFSKLAIKTNFYTPEKFFLGVEEVYKMDNFTGYNPLDYINSYKVNKIAEAYQSAIEECTKHNIIIMSGPPASGKTSFAKILEQRGFTRISLDETKFKKSLLTDKIVIDATHPNAESLNKYGLNVEDVFIVRMDVDKLMAKHLNTIRSWYYRVDKIPDIAYNVYYKKYSGYTDYGAMLHVAPDIFKAPKKFVQMFAMRTC